MYKLLLTILLSASLLYAELDTDVDSKKVNIKGEALTAHEVLDQIESQLDLIIELEVPDEFGYKKAYNHHVTVEQVVQAVVDYYRDYNKINLELLKRGKRRIILREKLERKPKPVSELADAKKRVESEVSPDLPNTVQEFDEPFQDTEKITSQIEKPMRSDAVISKLQFEISDLVALQHDNEKNQPELEMRGVEKEEEKEPEPAPAKLESVEEKVESSAKRPVIDKLELVDLEMPTSRRPQRKEIPEEPIKSKTPAKPRVLKVELVGEGLVDLDDDFLYKSVSKSQVSGNARSLAERLDVEQEREPSFFDRWKERETSEWVASPKVEFGYFGAYAPWTKPSSLAYKVTDSAKGRLQVGLGVGSHEDIGDPMDGVDFRSQKLLLSYRRAVADELDAHVRGGLVNNDGQLSVNGAVSDLNSLGLIDTVVGLNYIPEGLADYGDFSFGLEVSLPTGDDADFAGAGGLNFGTSAGYHVSFGRWRGETQLNLSFINDYDAFALGSESSVFSYDLGASYYIDETYDLGFNLHWAQSPWETTKGVWGEDALLFQTVLQTHAWTDPLSFYVDIGLSGAAPDFGFGLQWLKDFQ